MKNNTSSFTEIFFGNLDKDLVRKSGESNISFWGSENYFKKLKEPIDWEHGVLCIFQENDDEFWWKISGEYKKNGFDNFEAIKNELLEIHNDFNVITGILEFICQSKGDLLDIKDEYETADLLIEGEEDSDHFNIELFDKINLEENNSIWILETTRYKDLKYKIESGNLYLEYDSTDDLKLFERYIFSIVLKSNK